MADEAAESNVVTDGATVEGEPTAGEPFAADELGEPTAGETGEAAGGESAEEPELFTVKVGGDELQVSFDDLINGHMRQQDYTRKTQELAAQRAQVEQALVLQNALERDPRTTLIALAGGLGLQDLFLQQQVAHASGDEADPFEVLAREIQGLRGEWSAQQQAAFQAQQQAQQHAAIQAQVQQNIDALKGAHGDFDQQELLRYAVEHQTVDLRTAFNAWQYEKAEEARIAELNKARLAKRQAQVVAGGRATSTAGAVVPGSGTDRPSFREALRAALAAHSDQ